MDKLGDSGVKLSAAFFGGGLLAGILVNKFAMRDNKDPRQEVPEKWIRVGSVSQLVIYPVKSLTGIQVHEATVTPLGLKVNNSLRDRVFMVTNSNYEGRTLRIIPSLIKIQVSVPADGLLELTVKSPPKGVKPTFSLPLPKDDKAKKIVCRIWTNKVDALDCGDEVATWIDKVTESEGLRLVYYSAESSQRKLAANQSLFPTFSGNDTGSFQDETSYMLMTEESVAELNTKLSPPITERSFRPTIYVKGSPEPWVEDSWGFVRIGDPTSGPVFKAAMPCQRCKITTMDPDTGEVRPDGEPLNTLKSMKRQYGSAAVTKIVDKNKFAIMGNHLGLFSKSQEGGVAPKIKVGDPVYAALL